MLIGEPSLGLGNPPKFTKKMVSNFGLGDIKSPVPNVRVVRHQMLYQNCWQYEESMSFWSFPSWSSGQLHIVQSLARPTDEWMTPKAQRMTPPWFESTK